MGQKRFILLLLLSILIDSCNTKTEKTPQFEVQFELSDRYKSFPLPEDVGLLNPSFQLIDEEKFALLDYQTYQVLIFSIIGNELENSIQLETEGPNGVGKNIAGLFIESPNEIFLTTADNQLLKFNRLGQLVNKVALNTESLPEGVSLFSNLFLRNQDGFYFAAFPQVFEWTSLSPEELTQIPNLLKYDSLNNSFSAASYFPEEFIGTNLNKAIFPLLSLGPKGEPVINLNFRNIYYLNKGEVRSSAAGLTSFGDDPPTSAMPNMFEDMNEIMKMINHVDMYTDLYYLSAQDLLVRVAKFEDIPENMMDTNGFMASRWGLVFLNSSFQKIGELELEPNRYNPRYLFGTEEGIWISTAHPENPDLEEDFISFQLIEVKR